MFKTLKEWLVLAGVVFIVLLTFKLTHGYYRKALKEKDSELREEKIKASNLEKTAEGYYEKLVADTLTIKELSKKVDSLKIKAENPKIVERIVLKYREVEKPIDGIVVKDSIVETTDHYPNIEKPIITYTSTLNLLTEKGTSKFSFNKIHLNLVIDEVEEGLFKATMDAPDFVEIKSLHVEAIPLKQEKPDNFGKLAGVGVTKNLATGERGLDFTAGIRYKKIYLLGSAQTDGIVGLKVLFEW